MGTTQKSAIRVIANADTWMEDRAIQQLHRVADWPGMQTVVGMPDLHPGKGSPVGASFLSTNMFYPTLVGNDIGCGMAFWQTDLAAAKWSGQKLAERAGSIDGPMDDTPAIDASASPGVHTSTASAPSAAEITLPKCNVWTRYWSPPPN